jgi:hypothetical protein
VAIGRVIPALWVILYRGHQYNVVVVGKKDEDCVLVGFPTGGVPRRRIITPEKIRQVIDESGISYISPTTREKEGTILVLWEAKGYARIEAEKGARVLGYRANERGESWVMVLAVLGPGKSLKAYAPEPRRRILPIAVDRAREEVPRPVLLRNEDSEAVVYREM